MYNYITLPSNMRDFTHVVNLRIEEGTSGYGLYILILQLLRDMPDYKVSDNPRRLSFVFNEPDIELIDRVCHNYGLFDFDDNGLMYSPWLTESLEEYSTKKAKLQAAGKKGAARRWAAVHGEDGQAIATPSMDDGQAIAYNNTIPNIMVPNEMPSNHGEGRDWREILNLPSPKVSAEYMDLMIKTQPEGHCPGYVAQVCMNYGLSEAVCDFICERSDNASLTHPLYIKFCTLVKRINSEKWQPKHPANFFLSKLFE